MSPESAMRIPPEVLCEVLDLLPARTLVQLRQISFESEAEGSTVASGVVHFKVGGDEQPHDDAFDDDKLWFTSMDEDEEFSGVNLSRCYDRLHRPWFENPDPSLPISHSLTPSGCAAMLSLTISCVQVPPSPPPSPGARRRGRGMAWNRVFAFKVETVRCEIARLVVGAEEGLEVGKPRTDTVWVI
ncbi:hypothetical protein MNV49_007807 [Pseudohyphozyma bogoriensis]|nr:hypothetical protein MNV49_007807 [Pseudohyphozyma bogoriensis]